MRRGRTRCQWGLAIIGRRVRALLGHKARTKMTRWAERLDARIVRQAAREIPSA
jgi:hypothetical protein